MAGYSRASQWQMRPKLSGCDRLAPVWAGGAFPCLGFDHGASAGTVTGSPEPWRAVAPDPERWRLAIAGAADAIEAGARDGTLDPATVEAPVRACLIRLTGAVPGRSVFLCEQILAWHRLLPGDTARQRTMAALRQHGAALLRAG